MWAYERKWLSIIERGIEAIDTTKTIVLEEEIHEITEKKSVINLVLKEWLQLFRSGRFLFMSPIQKMLQGNDLTYTKIQFCVLFCRGVYILSCWQNK
jgi:hypothetical protein